MECLISLISEDWLVDRRHCNLKWQGAVMTIREKINSAIQDMPENEEIKQLLSGSCEFLTESLFVSVPVRAVSWRACATCLLLAGIPPVTGCWNEGFPEQDSPH